MSARAHRLLDAVELRAEEAERAEALAVGGAAQSFTLPIPNSPLLMGVDVYAQGVHDTQPVAPFSGFLGLPVAYYFTNALAGTLGY